MARKLDASIRSVISHVQSTTDSNELLGAILSEFGGPQELAKEIKKGYDEAQGMAKQRYMEMFQRLVLFTTKEDLSGKVDPSEMSDDDLFEAAKSVIRRMKETGEVIETDDKPVESAPVERLANVSADDPRWDEIGNAVEFDVEDEFPQSRSPHDSASIELPESETQTLSKAQSRQIKTQGACAWEGET